MKETIDVASLSISTSSEVKFPIDLWWERKITKTLDENMKIYDKEKSLIQNIARLYCSSDLWV